MARSTSEELAGYLQHRAKEWVKSGKPARQLAKAAGVSSAQISVLINDGVGAGWKTAEGMGKVFGMTMPELIDAAREWTASQPERRSPPTQAARRRALAAELSIEDGVSDEAVKSVLDEPLRDEDGALSTFRWILRMKRREIALAEASPRRGA